MESTSSKSNNKLTRLQLAILIVVVIIVSAIYLWSSQSKYKVGFPLDDSWIHQTYARNLALNGEWAFRPGQPSAGSTAPLWSALLAIGFLLNISPYIWTYILGGVVLFLLASLCEWTARSLIKTYTAKYPWAGIFIAIEWHLTWSAMSGMETLLHGLIVTTVLILLITGSSRYLTLGLLTGISVWVRPDGLTLIGPFLFVLFSVKTNFRSYLLSLVRYSIGFGSIFGLYLLFNLAVGGTPMPNTFYAKQAEYAIWQSQPIIERLGQMFKELTLGPGFLLIPGVIAWAVISIRRRNWGNLAAIIWCAGYLYLYASRLPIYQHGRYLMPAMSVFYLFGILAIIEFSASNMFGRYQWIAKTFWQTCLGLVGIIFLFLGANTYATDVAVIESEMVATAKWVSENIPSDAVIAAHDIGALGYFDDHELIDLAGLISPEVIPFIRDESKLSDFLDEKKVDYLITFPEFYPTFSQDLQPLYVTGSEFTLALGHKNMTVYQWKSP